MREYAAPLLTGFRWGLVALLTATLVVPWVVPLVTGHRLVVVDGGSMVPTYDPGDVLVTAPPSGDDLRVDAVVTIGDADRMYTHRVLEIDDPSAATGDRRARLKGDANTVPDPGWVTQDDVHAVPVTHLTGGVAATVRLTANPWGRLALVLAITALVLLPRRRSA